MPKSPQDVYARLLASPHGYPLWTPESSNEVERKEGLEIGDVGIVTPHDGRFDVFFNVCLPPNHPLHSRRGVPKGFATIDLDRLDIRTIPSAETFGHVISSPSVTRVEMAERPSSIPQRDRSGVQSYRFNLSCNEGALLILPKGAEQHDLLNENLFLEQVRQHGLEWHDYAVDHPYRTIGYDSLYMITGIHRARLWSIASFGNTKGSRNHTAHFKYTGSDNSLPAYSWEATRALDWRVGPHDDVEVPNQAIFVRGFRIMLRNRLLGTRRIAVEADTPSTRPTSSAKSPHVVSDNGSARSSKNEGNDALHTTTHCKGMSDFPAEDRLRCDVPHQVYDDTNVEHQQIQDIHLPFHPSDAINRYMLRRDPTAKIAVTHDKHWISILEEGLLTLDELAQESHLETVLSQNYRIVSSEGIVHLEAKYRTDTSTNNVPQAISEENTGKVSKQRRPADIDKVDSETEADHLPIRVLASRIVSLALEKMEQDMGLREVGAILHNMVKVEDGPGNMMTPELVAPKHAGIVTFVTFLPGSDDVLSVSEDWTIREWNISRDHQKLISEVSWLGSTIFVASPDGKRYAVGEHGKVRMCDVSKRILQSVEGHSSPVRSLSFSPDSSQVASGAQDGSVLVWCVTTGKLLAGPFGEHKNSVIGIGYAPDGRKFASFDKEVVYIRRDGSNAGLAIVEEAWSLAWSSGGDGLFVGGPNGPIKYFDPITGTLLSMWVGHSDAILCIAPSRSGKFFASASRDSTVRLWETTSHHQVGETIRHNSSVHSIAISPDDHWLVSGAWDGGVRLWDLKKRISAAPLLEGDYAPVDASLGTTTTWKPPDKSAGRVIFLSPTYQDCNPISKRSDELEIKRAISARDLYGVPPELSWDLTRFIRDRRLTMLPMAGRSILDIFWTDFGPISVKIMVLTKTSAPRNDPALKTFDREVDILRKLDHGNILPFLGIAKAINPPALVYPCTGGASLAYSLGGYDNSLTTTLRLVLIHDIAMGLQYLHSKSVVHGGLSASNILFRRNGRVCIENAGILPLMAKLQGQSLSKFYEQNRGLRTMVAPDISQELFQVNGPSDPTPESDIYSFGWIMLQILIGRSSHYCISHSQRWPPAHPKPDLPKDIIPATLVTDNQRKFLLRCWSEDRKERPSPTEIVEFVRQQLVEVVTSILQEQRRKKWEHPFE